MIKKFICFPDSTLTAPILPTYGGGTPIPCVACTLLLTLCTRRKDGYALLDRLGSDVDHDRVGDRSSTTQKSSPGRECLVADFYSRRDLSFGCLYTRCTHNMYMLDSLDPLDLLTA